MKEITMREAVLLARNCANVVQNRIGKPGTCLTVVGIPRGGVTAASLVSCELTAIGYPVDLFALGDMLVHGPTVLVDDILATGETMRRAQERVKPDISVVLVSKQPQPFGDAYAALLLADYSSWVTFPWEKADPDQGRPEDAVRRLIEYVGADPTTPELVETPRRVLKFLDELRERADGDFEATAFEIDHQDLVVVRTIPLYSLCPHHLLPFFGTAHVGYIPARGRVLGLSKLARAVAKESAGLRTQEALTAAVADSIKQSAQTEDVAVVTKAVHSCMIMRGVKAFGSETITSSMLGEFRAQPALRAEFLSLTVGGK